jgi:hypothetical protein
MLLDNKPSLVGTSSILNLQYRYEKHELKTTQPFLSFSSSHEVGKDAIISISRMGDFGKKKSLVEDFHQMENIWMLLGACHWQYF